MMEYFVKINMLENICYRSILTIYYEVMKIVFTYFKKQFMFMKKHMFNKKKRKKVPKLIFKKPFKCG